MLSFLKNASQKSAAEKLDRGQSGFRIATDVKASLHADGVVLMSLSKGKVFSANRVGAIVWNGATERWSLDRVAEAISKEFQIPVQTAQSDAAEFLAQLASEGLLIADAN